MKKVVGRTSFEDFRKRLAATGLRADVEEVLRGRRVSLRDLYEGPMVPSTLAARRAVYAALHEGGRGIREIGRLFDRSASGILKMINGA